MTVLRFPERWVASWAMHCEDDWEWVAIDHSSYWYCLWQMRTRPTALTYKMLMATVPQDVWALLHTWSRQVAMCSSETLQRFIFDGITWQTYATTYDRMDIAEHILMSEYLAQLLANPLAWSNDQSITLTSPEECASYYKKAGNDAILRALGVTSSCSSFDTDCQLAASCFEMSTQIMFEQVTHLLAQHVEIFLPQLRDWRETFVQRIRP